MYRRICILVLTVLAAVSVCFARTAGPGMRGPEITSPNINSPDGFKPDSLNTATSERNQRLYDSIQSKTNRRAVPRMLYRMLFVKPVLDTTFSGRVLDESRLLEPYAGKTVGDITIERRHPFDSDGNWLERTGNKIHMLTRDRVIRRDPALQAGRQDRPAADRAQQAAAPLAALHLRRRYHPAARLAGFDTRQYGHMHP